MKWQGREGHMMTNSHSAGHLLDDKEIYQALLDTNAIRKGHFQLTSGRHSDTYIQCARVLEHPGLTMSLARTAVTRLPVGTEVDLVVSPAVGGLVIGFAVAAALDCRFIFTERQNGAMVLRRAFEIEPGTRVLVVEDVVTTGGSVAEVIAVVESSGGVVVGVVSLIDRGGERKFSHRYWPLLSLTAESWDPSDCSLCDSGVEIYSPGSRRLAGS